MPTRPRRRRLGRRAAVRCAAAAFASLLALSAAADSPPDLLEATRAFALSARGVDPRTLEVRFTIAPGYYLYRDKLQFAVEGIGLARAPTLPAGVMKEDQFFGRSETYRGELVVRLPLAQPAGKREVALVADSQGCADLGVCYPAHRQRLLVPVPAEGTPAGPVVEAAPAKRRWFP